MRTALITGVVGQDGAYLSRHLLGLGYRVIGTAPPIPLPAGFVDAYLPAVELHLVDLRDGTGMQELLAAERPDEIYNLASVSSVAQSWSRPIEVAEVNGLGFLRLLESVLSLRTTGYEPRICQASSAEIFGTPDYLPQDELHPIRPSNPYAVAKAFAHFSAVNHRIAYDAFVSTVILFNHESPLRPSTFVTRKITSGVAEIAAGHRSALELGRLDIRRDWGSAGDYVRAMHLALAHGEPDDFCIASGESHELSELVEMAFSAAGIADAGQHIRINPEYLRPTDTPETRGDYAKARERLGWEPTQSMGDVVTEMVLVDLRRVRSGRENDPTYVVDHGPPA